MRLHLHFIFHFDDCSLEWLLRRMLDVLGDKRVGKEAESCRGAACFIRMGVALLVLPEFSRIAADMSRLVNPDGFISVSEQ